MHNAQPVFPTKKKMWSFSTTVFSCKVVMIIAMMLCCGIVRGENRNNGGFSSTSHYRISSAGAAHTAEFPSAQMSTQFKGSNVHQAYRSNVYDPFSNAAPVLISSGSSDGNNGTSRMSGRRNSGDGWVDSGEEGGSKESPVGEPWILLVFAVIAAGVVYMRNRKKSSSVLPEGKE